RAHVVDHARGLREAFPSGLQRNDVSGNRNNAVTVRIVDVLNARDLTVQPPVLNLIGRRNLTPVPDIVKSSRHQKIAHCCIAGMIRGDACTTAASTPNAAQAATVTQMPFTMFP